jgi:hypothetical protein
MVILYIEDIFNTEKKPVCEYVYGMFQQKIALDLNMPPAHRISGIYLICAGFISQKQGP